jgi:hypothetical protein
MENFAAILTGEIRVLIATLANTVTIAKIGATVITVNIATIGTMERIPIYAPFAPKLRTGAIGATVTSGNFANIVRPELFVTMLTSATTLISAITAPEVTIGIFPAIVAIDNIVAAATDGKIGILEAFLTDGIAVNILVDITSNSFLTGDTEGKIGTLEAILTEVLAVKALIDRIVDNLFTFGTSHTNWTRPDELQNRCTCHNRYPWRCGILPTIQVYHTLRDSQAKSARIQDKQSVTVIGVRLGRAVAGGRGGRSWRAVVVGHGGPWRAGHGGPWRAVAGGPWRAGARLRATRTRSKPRADCAYSGCSDCRGPARAGERGHTASGATPSIVTTGH